LDDEGILVKKTLEGKNTNENLVWDCVNPLLSQSFLKNEFTKSVNRELTKLCSQDCSESCGVCNKELKVAENKCRENTVKTTKTFNEVKQMDSITLKIIFSFAKKNSAVFQGHLAMVEIFSMSFVRAELPILYSQGFNPLPKLEIASPLSIGVEAEGEIAAVEISTFLSAEDFKNRLNKYLPEGILIGNAINISIPIGAKKHSLSSLLWGYTYKNKDESLDFVKAEDEKKYRLSKQDSPYGLVRHSVLAKHTEDKNKCESYFKVYQELYPSNSL
jgi:radical SAM-linked protein